LSEKRGIGAAQSVPKRVTRLDARRMPNQAFAGLPSVVGFAQHAFDRRRRKERFTGQKDTDHWRRQKKGAGSRKGVVFPL